MRDNIFNFLTLSGKGLEYPKTPSKIIKHRKPGYRTGDLILNKQDILNNIEFVDVPGQLPIPNIKRVEMFDLPTNAVPFSKAISGSVNDLIVVFYESDNQFARILHNPKRYVEPLKRFSCVVGPDFSQKVGMNPFVCYENSWWNKALTAYYQSLGIIMIPNVTWSTPDSYNYSFIGIPKHSVVAINCTGIKGNHASMYLWRKGYQEALRILEPTLIIRYGDKMPGEREDISVYFENINLKNLRNGRKRITC